MRPLSDTLDLRNCQQGRGAAKVQQVSKVTRATRGTPSHGVDCRFGSAENAAD